MVCSGKLRSIINKYMSMVSGLEVFTDRCLRSERWGGNVVLMVVDAAFTSIGLNYFTAVVPKVLLFKERYVDTGEIVYLRDLVNYDVGELRSVWRNMRSWNVAIGVADALINFGGSDREALRHWALKSSLDNWENDVVGRIRGVGLVTYQYLRMMGGVDTVMPDKIVKRVINSIFVEAGLDPVYDDMDFIRRVEEVARECGYRAIDLTWMTWLIQREGRVIRMEKYRDLMKYI